MALSSLVFGFGLYAENGELPVSPDYPNPPDFHVLTSRSRGTGRLFYNYNIYERSAGAFTLFAIGNFLSPNSDSGYDGALDENSNVNLNGNIVLGAIGLGYGRDGLVVKGSVSLSLISTDDDPSALLGLFQGNNMVGLEQGATASADNFAALSAGLTSLGAPAPGVGFSDKVGINGDINLGIVDTGLGNDSVKIGGALQGAILLLDGFAAIGGLGGDGNDSLEVIANSNLAAISCGAGNDQALFKAGATAVDINGGDGNDGLVFEQGFLGLYKPVMEDPNGDPTFQFLDVPLGVIAGGGGNDTITSGGGSSSYGVVIMGGDPFNSSVQPDDDDIVNFRGGVRAKPTFLKQSLIDLGVGADRLNFGSHVNTYKVIIKCGGPGDDSDGDIDILNFSSRFGARTSTFSNTTIIGFGDEDKTILGGTTYTGQAGRDALTAAGFTLWVDP